MGKIERQQQERRMQFSSFLPNQLNDPTGEFKDGLYHPYCYKNGFYRAEFLERVLGFPFKKAGIQIASDPYEVAESKALLGAVLTSDMDSTIPHYFMNLIPPKSKIGIPAYCARTFTTNDVDYRIDSESHKRKFVASILQEFGAKVNIDFVDHPPYCEFLKDEAAIDRTEPQKLFLSRIRQILDDDSQNPYDQQVAILAGIGKNTDQIVKKVYGDPNQQADEIRYGSDVISLARIAMALVNWGVDNPQSSLFLLSTTRLTNEQGGIPQAYLLDRTFKSIGMKPEWLGLAIVRAGALRDHPTGAVLVEIKPHQYKDILANTKGAFVRAVDKMRKNNPGLF